VVANLARAEGDRRPAHGLTSWRQTFRSDSPAAPLGLTQPEAEVLVLVAQGRTNRQIGQALFITPQDRQRPPQAREVLGH
jgi:DNA-binding NarL/FixJ family response regulator